MPLSRILRSLWLYHRIPHVYNARVESPLTTLHVTGSGKTYYFNDETQQSVWVKPEGVPISLENFAVI